MQYEEITASNDNLAMTMKHLGKCTTVVKNIILQYRWIFDLEEVAGGGSSQLLHISQQDLAL